MSQKTCSLCDKPTKAFGFCGTHYMRLRVHGDPNYTQITSSLASPEDRLNRHGWLVTDKGCWEWSGFRHAQGYGRLRIKGKLRLAHVVAYETWVGAVEPDEKVRHTCDNPPCINPKHLLKGTQADNVNDMVMRGRARNKRTGKL